MEHHVGSSAAGFSNPYAQARLTMYGISGIPNSFFDGVSNVLGGSTGTYSQFLSQYNNRIAVPSDYSVSIAGMNDGLDYTVVISAEKVVSSSKASPNLVVHLAMTESNVMYGSTPYMHVTRRFWPDQNGTPVDFSANPSQSVMLEFTMDAGWDLDECEFIAFIQDMSTEEIMQTEKVSVTDLMPLFAYNAGCHAINMVPVTNCSGTVSPVVTISNGAGDDLTEVEINYQVNDEEVNVYNWTGNLAYGATEMVTLPEVSFDVQDENDLLVYTTNPNGSPDEDPMNDTTSTSFVSANEAVPDIYLFLKLDGNPEESSWELKNSAGDVLYTGGDYTQANLLVKDTFQLDESDCYTFYLYDEGEDGLTGGGFFALRESNFNVIYENYEFSGPEELVQFNATMVSVDEIKEQTSFSVFPNPFDEQANIAFVLEEQANVEILVYNVIGEVVSSFESKTYAPGRHVEVFDAQDMNAGIYFVQVKIGENVFTKKISLR
jgi:hypothetical protein